MKKITLLAFSLFLTVLSFGQDKTLFENMELSIGGFGALTANLSTINDELTLLSGGGGGVVLNDFFIGGYGMSTNLNNTSISNSSPTGFENYDLNLSYGGLWMGYSFMDAKVVHPFAGLKMGLGNVQIYELNDNDAFLRENIFVVTPEVGIEINITRWIKLMGTVNYQALNGMDDTNFMNSSDFSGIGGGLSIRYGYFADYKN